MNKDGTNETNDEGHGSRTETGRKPDGNQNFAPVDLTAPKVAAGKKVKSDLQKRTLFHYLILPLHKVMGTF